VSSGILQPFAPHLAEELWSKLEKTLGKSGLALSYAPWPKHDPALLVESTVEIPVQVNGKLRDVVRVEASASKEALEQAALASAKVQQFIDGKAVRKIIVVPGKMVNVVVS
jgi:leucyl-tRNA synthetase